MSIILLLVIIKMRIQITLIKIRKISLFTLQKIKIALIILGKKKMKK